MTSTLYCLAFRKTTARRLIGMNSSSGTRSVFSTFNFRDGLDSYMTIMVVEQKCIPYEASCAQLADCPTSWERLHTELLVNALTGEVGARIRSEQKTKNAPASEPTPKSNRKIELESRWLEKKLGPSWVQNSGQLAPVLSLSSGRATESTRFMERAMGIEPTSESWDRARQGLTRT